MWSSKYMSLFTTLGVFVALFSIIYQGFFAAKELQRITLILGNLMRIENLQNLNIPKDGLEKPRIAVGYGSCSDLYVRASVFLNYTDDVLKNSDEDYNDDLNNIDEVLQSFAYYFKHGAAAERFTPNTEFFLDLVAKAKRSGADNFHWALGGNAPVMSNRFYLEGADVLLAGQMTDKLRTHLPNEIRLIGEPIAIDDIHLIIEYTADEKWGPFTAPRANRYILHNDQHNPTVTSLEHLDRNLGDFNPRLLVVSGLQMMDNFPFKKGVRESRITKIGEQLKVQLTTTLIHFEMASFVELELLQQLIKNVIPFSDSIGMNEQEIDNLVQVLEHGQVSVVADSNPKVSRVLTQMRSVFKILNTKHLSGDMSGRRMLTRIHVHTLAYQAIMTVKDSEWKYTKNAAAKASLRAFRHVCNSERINPESAYLVLDDSFSTASEDPDAPSRIQLNYENPVPCWYETITLGIAGKALLVEICLAPVLVCRHAKQTAGAGDNISASGLILQI